MDDAVEVRGWAGYVPGPGSCRDAGAGCPPGAAIFLADLAVPRPGLQYMVSTGRHHGFESHAEQQLLLALDFAGDLEDVLSQPFRLAFTADDGPGEHTPDFLAVTRGGAWLIDVRPGERIKAEDRTRFAAAAEVALSPGPPAV